MSVRVRPSAPIEVYMKKLFSFSGRVSRTQYWLTALFAIPSFLFILFAGAFSIPTFGLKILFILACFVAYLWVQLSVVIRRCRDAGIDPLWTIALFLPYVNVITFIVIGVLPRDY